MILMHKSHPRCELHVANYPTESGAYQGKISANFSIMGGREGNTNSPNALHRRIQRHHLSRFFGGFFVLHLSPEKKSPRTSLPRRYCYIRCSVVRVVGVRQDPPAPASCLACIQYDGRVHIMYRRGKISVRCSSLVQRQVACCALLHR